MKTKPILLFAGALLASASSVCANAKEMTVGEFMTKTEFSRVTDMIGSAGQALSWANSELKSRGQPELYCSPGSLAITTDQYMQILMDDVNAHAYGPGSPAFAWPTFLLEGLIKAFPCAGAKP